MDKLEVNPIKQLAQNQSKTNKPKLVLLSRWKFNPYQKLLVEHLAKMGVEIEELNCPTIFLPRLLKHKKPNFVHFHSLHSFFLTSSRLKSLVKLVVFLGQVFALRLIGTKIIWTVHDLKSHSSQYLKIDRFGTTLFMMLTHKIITHYEVAKREVITTLGLKNEDKIFVIPHGNYIDYYENKIDRIEARRALSIPSSSLMFLFLGRIEGYKGVVEMIDAFKQLNNKEAQLVIAGKIETKELENLLKQKIAGEDNIQLISGFVPDKQIQVYMNACDVVEFPYLDILTSGAVLLAMSFGRACIAPRMSCFTEVLDESGAFFYNPDIADGLLQAMDCAIQRQSEVLNMGEHNRQIVEQWSWNYVANKTLQVYQQ
ncbi:glycosyltransferase family 4 protein [Synechocystis sp. PCC 7509]|uniref:glycosyltransferase family 4 protein n=1 Tax=Synechocystis sp. PCC 7509 TaxID=927677 RepID=UPI0002ACE2A2|nr:glycosyltransferase family 4 protein [Synechocystis sp. PCC 7509]